MKCTVFTDHLQNTFADFIANLDAFPLCDHLLQIGILHQQQYDSILDEHRENRLEANKSLFKILEKTEYTPEQLRKLWTAFKDSSQESLLSDFGSLRISYQNFTSQIGASYRIINHDMINGGYDFKHMIIITEHVVINNDRSTEVLT